MKKELKRLATLRRIQKTGLELFYRFGYHNTSIDDILKELSLSKGAFYYHFNSKEDFFIRIVDELIAHKMYSLLIEPIEGHDNPIVQITQCFENALENAVHNEGDNGFVLANFISEFKGSNNRITEHLNVLVLNWEVNLISALQRGKFNGQIDRHVDVESAAQFLMSSFIGVRSMMLISAPSSVKYRFMTQLRQFFRSIEVRSQTERVL